jgi:hypothetical protein
MLSAPGCDGSRRKPAIETHRRSEPHSRSRPPHAFPILEAEGFRTARAHKGHFTDLALDPAKAAHADHLRTSRIFRHSSRNPSPTASAGLHRSRPGSALAPEVARSCCCLSATTNAVARSEANPRRRGPNRVTCPTLPVISDESGHFGIQIDASEAISRDPTHLHGRKPVVRDQCRCWPFRRCRFWGLESPAARRDPARHRRRRGRLRHEDALERPQRVDLVRERLTRAADLARDRLPEHSRSCAPALVGRW